ncbi:MAG: hypothetical protein QHH10_08130 [Peptococcaceae bacterium]|nr:hypothetical protein [Peptococcaceae bacterium]MDH7525261.1 hypothetical protein [Peptococcaceae bacterium]
MKILIEFTPDEVVHAAKTGTLQALFEATKVAEKHIEAAAQAINKPILSEDSVPTMQAPAAQAPAAQVPAPAVVPTPTTIPTAAPVAPPPAAPAATVPTATQTYTVEQLAVAATQLIDAGQRDRIIALLKSFGVDALMMLPKEQYGAFATQLRALGAKI